MLPSPPSGLLDLNSNPLGSPHLCSNVCISRHLTLNNLFRHRVQNGIFSLVLEVVQSASPAPGLQQLCRPCIGKVFRVQPVLVPAPLPVQAPA